MSETPVKEIRTIEDLEQDSMNVNKGSERGHYMIDYSLTNLGAGRSVLADRNGRLIAGNKTAEIAAEHGFPVEVIRTDGKKLIVVQRTDLDLSGDGEERDRARLLAIADNRASEVGYVVDAEVLLAHQAGGVDISPMFSDGEMGALAAALAAGSGEFVDNVNPPEDFKSYDDRIDTDYCCPKCGYEWSGKAK